MLHSTWRSEEPAFAMQEISFVPNKISQRYHFPETLFLSALVALYLLPLITHSTTDITTKKPITKKTLMMKTTTDKVTTRNTTAKNMTIKKITTKKASTKQTTMKKRTLKNI